ncbi:hypothetical protein ABEB36_014529 [Hypothenemus hampei]|uniref:Uncharacterized protein n=1 Tax=Hypothenemus hampei TaxID=57062 RepID=A0ABD1E2C1_HYPHA
MNVIEEDDYFRIFEPSAVTDTSTSNYEAEFQILNFFSNSCVDLSILNMYLEIKAIFTLKVKCYNIMIN